MNKLKLNIQRFSGGSYDYISDKLDMYCSNNMHDIELDDLIKDLIPLLHELEWWQSGDTREENYRAEVKKFKEKWFGTERVDRLKGYIDENIEKTKNTLYGLITNSYFEDRD